MIIKKLLSTVIFTIIFVTAAISDSALEDKAKKKLTNKLDQGVGAFSNKVSENIASFAKNNFNSLKYLDFSVDTAEYLKPTFSIMSVTELLELNNGGTIFNQTSLNTHDSDETINIGFGARKLLYDNKLIFGINTFYDHQFDENHKRIGLGAETISSLFDLRGNYYNAMSDLRTNKEGSYKERALDGWDLRGDYHLPIQQDVNIFMTAYKFKNPQDGSDFEDKGNKFGADAKLGNFVIEAGYDSNNREKDNYFGSVKYVVALGDNVKKGYYALSEIEDPISDKKMKDSYRLASLKKLKKAFEYTSVEDKLYQPVKRENKIRVVKISASGFVASGF